MKLRRDSSNQRNPGTFLQRNLNTIAIHVAILIALSTLIYVPRMGKGFIHDDYMHLAQVAYQPLEEALLQPSSGMFFTPITNFSFQLDLWLWGGTRPFPMAAENFLLHLANILLLYALAIRIWQSTYVALWTALGFSLLFPSNTWAALWIATRAHILAAFFYFLTFHAVIWLAKSKQHRALPILAVLACAASTLLSKESGITIMVAVPIMLFYYKKVKLAYPIVFSDYILFGSLLAVFAGYLEARAASGAIAIAFNSTSGYSYDFDWKIISENLLRYVWRTYGLLSLLAAAIFLKRYFQGLGPRLTFVLRSDVVLSLSLFILTLGPFLMMRGRSGIYTYLPGLCAALLLGAVLQSFLESAPDRHVQNFSLAALPLLFVVSVFTVFSFGHGNRWVTMARSNTSIMRQIRTLQPSVEPHSLFVLEYDESGRVHRFPDGLTWGFPSAVRLLYDDATLDGILIQKDAQVASGSSGPRICFEQKPAPSLRIEKKPCN